MPVESTWVDRGERQERERDKDSDKVWQGVTRGGNTGGKERDKGKGKD